MDGHMEAHIALVIVHIIIMLYASSRFVHDRKVNWLMLVGVGANAFAAFIHAFKAVDLINKLTK